MFKELFKLIPRWFIVLFVITFFVGLIVGLIEFAAWVFLIFAGAHYLWTH